jgi:hypothetical protein
VACLGARAAARAFFLVDVNDFPNHFDPSFGLSVVYRKAPGKSVSWDTQPEIFGL